MATTVEVFQVKIFSPRFAEVAAQTAHMDVWKHLPEAVLVLLVLLALLVLLVVLET